MEQLEFNIQKKNLEVNNLHDQKSEFIRQLHIKEEQNQELEQKVHELKKTVDKKPITI